MLEAFLYLGEKHLEVSVSKTFLTVIWEGKQIRMLQNQEGGGMVGTYAWLSPSISGSDDYRDI